MYLPNHRRRRYGNPVLGREGVHGGAWRTVQPLEGLLIFLHSQLARKRWWSPQPLLPPLSPLTPSLFPDRLTPSPFSIPSSPSPPPSLPHPFPPSLPLFPSHYFAPRCVQFGKGWVNACSGVQYRLCYWYYLRVYYLFLREFKGYSQWSWLCCDDWENISNTSDDYDRVVMLILYYYCNGHVLSAFLFYYYKHFHHWPLYAYIYPWKSSSLILLLCSITSNTNSRT